MVTFNRIYSKEIYSVLRETTDWGDSTPNHTYHLNKDGRVVGYTNVITGTYQEFNNPLLFDKKGRTFEKVTK